MPVRSSTRGKSSSWIKGKVISQDGSMITIDLGTRVLKVNSSKIRKDHQPIEDVDIPLEPVAMHVTDKTVSARAADNTASACHADTTASNGCNSRKETDPASKLLHADALLSGPEGVAYGTYNWEPITKGKIDFLELFSGSARLSQVAAMNGLKVGTPIEPSVVFMAPECAPWSQMTNINDRNLRDERDPSICPWWNFVFKLPFIS